LNFCAKLDGKHFDDLALFSDLGQKYAAAEFGTNQYSSQVPWRLDKLTVKKSRKSTEPDQLIVSLWDRVVRAEFFPVLAAWLCTKHLMNSMNPIGLSGKAGDVLQMVNGLVTHSMHNLALWGKLPPTHPDALPGDYATYAERPQVLMNTIAAALARITVMWATTQTACPRGNPQDFAIMVSQASCVRGGANNP
jgi:hypothetical protein